jgi:hypothetical protein
MATSNTQTRLSNLEAEVEKLKEQIANGKPVIPQQPWWEKIWGTFANDPYYDEAMELGRKYRESLRPKEPRRQKAKPGKKSKS